jgi:hypothetical protein
MALRDYTIKFTDSAISGKNDILVGENTVNNSNTSLTLYGYGHKNYGTGLWENMLHIMENFASSTEAPAHPTIGQLWYHSGKKSLLIFVGTDDTAASNGWKNIVSNYDFSNNIGGEVVQYLTKSDLVGYLTSDVTPQLTGDLVLKNNDSWYTTVAGVVRLSTSVTIPGNYAASVRYVNTKVDTVVTDKITTALAANPATTGTNTVTGAVSADSISVALANYDTTGSPVGANHPYIRRASTSPEESRTMYNSLILPAQTTAVVAGDDNFAATKGYVRAVLTAGLITNTATSTITGSSGTDTITGASTKDVIGTPSYLPLAGGTLNGKLYLASDETGYSDTNKNRAATRAYVDYKFGLVETTTASDTITSVTSSDTITSVTATDIISSPDKTFTDGEKLNNKDRELISYTKFPDGTLMVYGFYRNFGVSYKDDGRWASSLSKITFPDGIKFTNNYYSVSITEEVPTVTLSPTVPSGKPAVAPFTYKSCDNVRRSGLWKDFSIKYPGFYKFRGSEILNKESDLKLTYIPSKYNQPVSENYNVANTSLWNAHWTEMSKVTTGNDFTGIAPTTFSVFEKETDGFRLSAYNDNGGGSGAGLTYLFWRNFIACNFTAIGRWK